MDDKKLKRMEIAKTGSFGADGATITLKDLRDVVETFDGKGPVSLGHYMTKQDWWPSWGNVESIDLVENPNGIDGVMQADVSLNPELAQAIDEGFYTGWSISMPARATDGKKYLHHLAMLGSVPPKIRDLKIITAVGSTKPDNAIDATGEGTAFGDYSYFNFADFPKEAPQDTKTSAAPLASNPDFADVERQTAKAKKIYKEGVKAQLVSAVGDKWPTGMKGKLEEFADLLIESHDYEFADDGQAGSLVQFFINLVKGMNGSVPKPGRMTDFSDSGRAKPDVAIDRAGMAQKF
ncbi:hypothetical protein [Parasphaerochaeta coccoides]|uniref:hypothetical protein n=1 Tax=Parasphaerochaeta coccoides TaxID=273376 RepID=UPI0002E5275D|nr:hypothetical protein [Parasphaerochaeta coccoides]